MTGELGCTGLTKRYGEATVLTGVDLTLPAGSVLGLIGENGAGKSTLCSIIGGIVRPDAGSMRLDGASYAPSSPAGALAKGVVIIHQELKMIPDLSVAENMFLGRWPTRRGHIDRRRMEYEAGEILSLLGTDLDPAQRVGGLSVAAQQEIEIGRAIARRPRYVVFDEPSAALGQHETTRVLEQIRALRTGGAGVVYISHRLDEVTSIADEIVCLRDGHRVNQWREHAPSKDTLIKAMVGRELAKVHESPRLPRERVVMRVDGVGRKGVFADVTFSVREGEILGVFGLVGAGRTEMVRALCGADRTDSGTVEIDGRRVRIKDVRSGLRAGIAMVPEDRKGQGLNLARSGAQNIVLPWERSLTRSGFVTSKAVERVAGRLAGELDIRGALHAPVGNLSGGNQQKVLFAKWLVKRPRVLILDEPTRGVDIGAKTAIYRIIRELAAAGVAIILVSSELEEVLGLSHRIMVMAGGRPRGDMERGNATADRVMEMSIPTDAGAAVADTDRGRSS